jgi:hypothetical protein
MKVYNRIQLKHHKSNILEACGDSDQNLMIKLKFFM